MTAIIVVVLFATVYVLGVLTGIRYQDRNLRRRERNLARGRADLHDRARALDAYAGISRMVLDARDQVAADAVLRDDLPVILSPLPGETATMDGVAPRRR